MSQPVVKARVNDTVQFTCETPGEALSLCVWERKIGGERQMVIIDGQQAEGKTSVDGVEYFGGRLSTGKCGLQLDPVKPVDFNPWTCTLLTNSRQIFTGTVELIDLGKNSK